MKKNLLFLCLIAIIFMVSTVSNTNTVSAANDSLPVGIYVDGNLHTTIAEFKKLKTAEKTKLLMTSGVYLSLGKHLIETKNIITMSNQQLENSKITVAQYEAIIGGPITPEFEIITIE